MTMSVIRYIYFTFILIIVYPVNGQNTYDAYIKYADSLRTSKDTTALIEFLLLEHEKNQFNITDIEGEIGSLYLMINKLELSNRYLQIAIQKDKHDYNSHYNLACLYAKKGNITTSFDYLEKSIRAGWDDYEWLMADADLRYVRADDRFKLLKKKHYSKKDLKVLGLCRKGLKYSEAGKKDLAAKTFLNAIKKEKKTKYVNLTWVTGLYTLAGHNYAAIGKHNKSISCYEKAIPFLIALNNKINLAQTYSDIGFQYSKTKEHSKEIQNHLNAIELYKDYNDSMHVGLLSNSIAMSFYSQDDLAFSNSGIADSVGKYLEISSRYGFLDSELGINIIDTNIEIIGYLVVYYISKAQLEGIDKILYWSEFGFYLADKYEREEEKAMFSMAVGFPLALIVPDRALPFLLHTYDYLTANQKEADGFGINGIINLYYFLYLAFNSVGDLDKTLHYLTEGVQFADNKNSELPIANFMRGKFAFFDDRKTDSRNYYNKVIESVDLNNPDENSLYGFAISEIISLQIMDGDIDKAFEDAFLLLERSEKSNIPIDKVNALSMIWIIAILKENFDVVDMALDELIQVYETWPITSNLYVKEVFDNWLVIYELSIISKLLKDEFIEAASRLESAKNRSLKQKLNVPPAYWAFTAMMEDEECVLAMEEINSSSNLMYKNAASKRGLFDSVFSVDEKGLDLLFTYYNDNYDEPSFNIKSKEVARVFNEKYPLPKVLAKIYLNELKNSWRDDWKDDQLDDLSNKLYGYLIQDYEEDIQGKIRLILVPDPIYSNIPMETLKDQDGRYLVEKFDISYVQSYTILSLLQKRQYDNYENNVLAIGNPNYESVSYSEIPYEEADFASVFRTGSVEYKVKDIYGTFGYSNWPSLPGSMNEINNIVSQIKGSKSITAFDANESNIKSLSAGGELLNYNIIHFATHGVIMPDIPDISALVLTQNADNMGGEDGYLTVGEVSELKIEADLVNLSACETGLGKVYAGDGVVGLTSAFMEAGANGVCVSLWPVDDKSTSIFMGSFYGKIADGDSFHHALSEVKRDFIAGEYGEKYKSPYYWAPFVYYGK